MPKRSPVADQHAKFSPSKLTRIITCPGSVRLTSDIQQAESSYAAEGTMLHKVTEKCLDDQLPQVPLSLIRQYELDFDQRDAVNTILTWVTKKRLRYSQYEFFETVETKGTLGKFNSDQSTCDELEDVYGTLDYSMYIPEIGRLICADWKFGAGIEVQPDCPQLKAYALTKIGTYANLRKYKDIILVVGQPRLHGTEEPIKTHHMTPDELFSWMREDLIPALRNATSRNPRFKATEEACRWCPIKARCAHRYDVKQQQAAKIFGTMTLQLGQVPIEDLIELRKSFKGLKKYMTDIEAFLVNTAKKGTEIPGHKMVRGRANRAWGPNEEVIVEFLEDLGFEDDVYYTKPKLKSPAQIEKAVGKTLAKSEGFKKLITKPKGKATLVPESDSRTAINYETTEDVFGDFIEA